VRQDLGVAAGAESVPDRGQLPPDVEVVVQLPVLDGPDVARLVRDRLMPALHVDDAEPSDAEGDSVTKVRAAVVRPTVGHRVGHAVEDLGHDERSRLSADLG
jgi:hypothetical protein